MTRSFAVLFLLVATPALAQVTIYPGEDIQAVINVNPPGTTYTLAEGTHRMQRFTPQSGDTFQGVIGPAPFLLKLTILSGARDLTNADWQFDGARWYVEGQTQDGAAGLTLDPTACLDSHPRCNHPEDLFFDDTNMKIHEDVLAEVGPGEWFFDYDADRIYVGDDPHGHVVETSVTPQVFFPSAASDVTIKSMIVEKYASPTQTAAVNLGNSLAGGERWLATDVIAWRNHGAGIGNDTRTSSIANLVSYNCEFGFVGAGVNVVIEDNVIEYNNVRSGGAETEACGYNNYFGAGGSKWVHTTNLRVRNNWSHHNYGPGLWTDINNNGCLYQGNTVNHNQFEGISHEISGACRITGNTIVANGFADPFGWWTSGSGIQIVESTDVEVDFNTVQDNKRAIMALEDHRVAGVRNLNVHNNTIQYTVVPEFGQGWTGIIEWVPEGTVPGAPFSAEANNHFETNSYTNVINWIWIEGAIDFATWNAYGHDD